MSDQTVWAAQGDPGRYFTEMPHCWFCRFAARTPQDVKKVFHPDIYSRINAPDLDREASQTLLDEHAEEIERKTGRKAMKVIVAKTDTLRTTTQYDTAQASAEMIDKKKTGLTFSMRPATVTTMPPVVKPGNVLDRDPKSAAEKVVKRSWTEINENLQRRMENQTVIKCQRQAKFTTFQGAYGNTHALIGLQWVTEFQKPDSSSTPWYMCYLCKVRVEWKEILQHVTSMKHRLEYMKKDYDALYNEIKSNRISQKDPIVKVEGFARKIFMKETLQPMVVMLELKVGKDALTKAMNTPAGSTSTASKFSRATPIQSTAPGQQSRAGQQVATSTQAEGLSQKQSGPTKTRTQNWFQAVTTSSTVTVKPSVPEAVGVHGSNSLVGPAQKQGVAGLTTNPGSVPGNKPFSRNEKSVPGNNKPFNRNEKSFPDNKPFYRNEKQFPDNKPLNRNEKIFPNDKPFIRNEKTFPGNSRNEKKVHNQNESTVSENKLFVRDGKRQHWKSQSPEPSPSKRMRGNRRSPNISQPEESLNRNLHVRYYDDRDDQFGENENQPQSRTEHRSRSRSRERYNAAQDEVYPDQRRRDDNTAVGHHNSIQQPRIGSWADENNSKKNVPYNQPFNRNEKSFPGNKPFNKNEKSFPGNKPFNRNEKSVPGNKKFNRNEKSVPGNNPFNINEKSVPGNNQFNRNENSVPGNNKPFNRNEKSFPDNKPFNRNEKQFPDNKQLNRNENIFPNSLEMKRLFQATVEMKRYYDDRDDQFGENENQPQSRTEHRSRSRSRERYNAAQDEVYPDQRGCDDNTAVGHHERDEYNDRFNERDDYRRREQDEVYRRENNETDYQYQADEGDDRYHMEDDRYYDNDRSQDTSYRGDGTYVQDPYDIYPEVDRNLENDDRFDQSMSGNQPRDNMAEDPDPPQEEIDALFQEVSARMHDHEDQMDQIQGQPPQDMHQSVRMHDHEDQMDQIQGQPPRDMHQDMNNEGDMSVSYRGKMQRGRGRGGRGRGGRGRGRGQSRGRGK